MIDWRDVPSLSALRAFHAYATTGSVVEAGMRLNVSHAAISQHVRTLEEELGVQLIDRSGRAGVLTTNGTHLSEALELGFGAITRTIRAMSDADSDRPLVVTTTPAFAARWLLPRLAQFRAEYPGSDMVIDPTPEVRMLEPGGRISPCAMAAASGRACLPSRSCVRHSVWSAPRLWSRRMGRRHWNSWPA